MSETQQRYRSLSSWLKEIFGERVHKITLDSGLGCPNRDGTLGVGGCIYCNSRGSGNGEFAKGKTISEQLKIGISAMSERYKVRKFIAYMQSFSNTYAPIHHLKAIYAQALHPKEIVGLAVGTRPDLVGNDVLELLAEFSEQKLVWLELGLQSAHNDTLKLLNRGHDAEAFFNAVERSNRFGLRVIAHLILGLPHETLPQMRATARAVSDAGVHGVKLHPLYAVRGTVLAKMVECGTCRLMTEDEAADATIAVLEELSPEIVIHRLTSDPHPEELFAPDWMLDKRAVRNRLQKELSRRNIFQGARRMRK
jgi:hypothetical protein